MKTPKTRKVTISISIFIYQKSKLVYKASLRSQTKIYDLVRWKLAENGIKWDKGTCVIYYDKAKQFWNKFNFNDIAGFKHGFNPCVEPELLKYMGVKT